MAKKAKRAAKRAPKKVTGTVVPREAIPRHADVLSVEIVEVVEEIVVWRDAIRAVVAAYREGCAKLGPKGEMPQVMIALAAVSDDFGSLFREIRATFDRQAIVMRRHGRFQAGDHEVTFETKSGRRSPAWKTIAVENAARVAELRGKKFNEKRYVDRVVAQTDASEDTVRPVILART